MYSHTLQNLITPRNIRTNFVVTDMNGLQGEVDNKSIEHRNYHVGNNWTNLVEGYATSRVIFNNLQYSLLRLYVT